MCKDVKECVRACEHLRGHVKMCKGMWERVCKGMRERVCKGMRGHLRSCKCMPGCVRMYEYG